MGWVGKYKRLDFGLCLAVFAAAVGVRFVYEHHQFDDAFITFRYCLNLVEGKGFVYNAGSRVLGTTTPLFTLLLAGLGLLFRTHDFPLLANVVNHLADGGTAVVLYFIGLRLWRSRALAALLGLFFAFSYHSVFYSGAGLETSFYAFLLVFALERALRRRFRAALLLAALALLTRPDALLLACVLAVYLALFERRRIRLKHALPAAALLLAYLVFLKLYFGSVIPNSMAAKSYMYGSGHGLFTLDFPNWFEVMMFWAGFLTKSHSSTNLAYNYLLLLPMLLMVGAGCVELALRSRRILVLPAFGLLFTFAYVKAGGFLFPWYIIPTVPFLSLLVFAGVKLMGARLARALRRDPVRGAAVVCGMILVMQSLVFIGARTGVPSAVLRTMYPAHTRRLYLAALGKIPPQQRPFTIMAPEIGYIGYYRPEARIIDPIGLTNPEVVAFYKRQRLKLPDYMQFVTREVVEEFQPDYIITLYAFKNPRLEEEPSFQRRYEQVEVPLDGRFEDREPVYLFKKRAGG